MDVFTVLMVLVIWGVLGVVGVVMLAEDGVLHVVEPGPTQWPWWTLLLGPVVWICTFGDWVRWRGKADHRAMPGREGEIIRREKLDE